MNLEQFQENEFDFAVLSLTLHEMPPAVRTAVLREAKRISKQIIILDYKIPAPMNAEGITALYFEFVAGYHHLKNYLHFRDQGGLDYLLKEAGLKKEKEIFVQQGTIAIIQVK